MSKPYAIGTNVASSRSTAEIQTMLQRRGVTKFATFHELHQASIAFEYEGVPYRISLPLPEPTDKKFTRTPTGRTREQSAVYTEFDNECNRRWRAFLNVIKARLIAVEEGITTMSVEFIGAVVLPSGRTVSETYSENLPQLALSGRLEPLSLGGRGSTS